MMSLAIVLGVTADLAFAAGAVLASIRAGDPKCDATAVILHDGLDPDQAAAFRRLWPGCRLQEFGAGAAVARLGPVAEPVQGFLRQYSPLALAKLELPDLLEDFERVVWLDADILVRGSLQGLWSFDCLAWRGLPAGAFGRRAKSLRVFAELDLDPTVPLPNGGVIGVSRRFLELGGSTALLQGFARRLAQEAPGSQIDELPWYLAAASLGMPVRALPMTMNHPVGAKGAEAAVVVHAIGPHKFWNATPLRQLYPDWSRHQATWVASGGKPYAGEVLLGDVHPDEPHEVLRAAQARAHWLEVFRALWPVLPRGMVVDLQHDRKHLRILLQGRPEGEHLRLHRHANARRIGLEAVLPAEAQAAVVAAVTGGVKWARHESGALVSVPLTGLPAALAAAAEALAGPASP